MPAEQGGAGMALRLVCMCGYVIEGGDASSDSYCHPR